MQADAYFDGEEAQLKLQKAILTLPEKQRLVFNMRFYEEMPYKEMSKIFDTSVGALKVLSSCKQESRKILKPNQIFKNFKPLKLLSPNTDDKRENKHRTPESGTQKTL